MSHLLLEEVDIHELQRHRLVSVRTVGLLDAWLAALELGLENVLLHVLQEQVALVAHAVFKRLELVEKRAKFVLLFIPDYRCLWHVPLLWLP